MKHLYTFSIICFFLHLSYSTTYKLVDKEIKEENKTKNYTISVTYPQMEGFKDKSTQGDFNKYVYVMVKQSADDFKNEMVGWVSNLETPSEFEIGYTNYLQNENLVSLRFDGYQYYSGAAHPTTFFFSVDYNLAENEPIVFSALFKGDYLAKISDYCIQDLIRQKNEYAPDNNDVSWIKEGAGPADDNFEVFNIKDTSLLITFPVYHVASYAEGPKEVEIPFTKIMNIIDKKGPLGYIIK